MKKDNSVWIVLVVMGLTAICIFLIIQVLILTNDPHRFNAEETENFNTETRTTIVGEEHKTDFTVYFLNIPFWMVKGTTLHEFAHYYMQTQLNYNQELQYYNITEDADEFISTYARTNYMEDFAESFEHITDFCYYEEELKDLTPERQEFFRDNVLDDFNECTGSRKLSFWQQLLKWT